MGKHNDSRPAPTEHQLTDADAGAEFVRDPVLMRAGYVGSFFHNDVTSLAFDNPYRAIDTTSASSRGRLTLAPTNSYNGVNGMASVKLPRRSRASAYVSAGVLTDAGDPIVPQTINWRSRRRRSTGRPWTAGHGLPVSI